jgi:hypothetical protein
VADDIVTRLRTEHYHVARTACISCDAADEIERLRVALALAVGELSTHGQYSVYSPDQLMQQFLEEACRG